MVLITRLICTNRETDGGWEIINHDSADSGGAGNHPAAAVIF